MELTFGISMLRPIEFVTFHEFIANGPFRSVRGDNPAQYTILLECLDV